MRKKTEKKTTKKPVKTANFGEKMPKKKDTKIDTKKTTKKDTAKAPKETKKAPKKLTAKQLEHYRELLLEKRREIQGDVGMMEENIFQSGGEISSMPVHLADIGTDSYEQEFSLGLMAEEKKILDEINKALDRIINGTYGICDGLDVPIEPNRLEAIPWTRYSLQYAKMVENGQDPRLEGFKRRPIDIERDSDSEDSEEEVEDSAEETGEKIEFDDTMESLEELEEEEDSDYQDDDIDRQRDSA